MDKALIRHFWGSPTETQRKTLHDRGFSERQIYVVSSIEDVQACAASYRGKPGKIYFAADLRVLGDNYSEIQAGVDVLEGAGLLPVDFTNEGLKTWRAACDYVRNRLIGHNRRGSKRDWLKRSSKGGKNRGRSFQAKRNELVEEDRVNRLVAVARAKLPLTLRLLSWCLGDGFAPAILSRKYGKDTELPKNLK